MARIRYIKPEFFTDEDIAELPFEARLLFQGLWCYADREGRLEDRPKFLKISILPYDNIDIEKLLDILANGKKKFIIRYTVNNNNYIQIVNFTKHQKPHNTEKDSEIPKYDNNNILSKTKIKTEIGMEKGTIKGMGSVPQASPKLNNGGIPVKKQIETKLIREFEEFYATYPKHKAKKEGLKAWLKVKPPLKECLEALKWQKVQEDWRKEGGKYIPLPASWIRGERWLDEKPKPQQSGGAAPVPGKYDGLEEVYENNPPEETQ